MFCCCWELTKRSVILSGNVDKKVLECLECAQSLAVAVGEVRKLTQNFISIVDTKYRLCQLSI